MCGWYGMRRVLVRNAVCSAGRGWYGKRRVFVRNAVCGAFGTAGGGFWYGMRFAARFVRCVRNVLCSAFGTAGGGFW